MVGTPALEGEFVRHGFTLDDRDPQVAVLGFDTALTYAKLWKLCDFVRGGLPYIATHPDLNCPTETGPMPDTGATIAFVQASTGRAPDLVVGKPNRLIAEAAARKLGLPLSALAMVGDRLYTDIALGATSGDAHLSRAHRRNAPRRPGGIPLPAGFCLREPGRTGRGAQVGQDRETNEHLCVAPPLRMDGAA